MNRDLFDEEIELPSRRAQQRLDALVGLDDIKAVLSVNATVLLDAEALPSWSTAHYGSVIPIVKSFAHRTPLFVFAGDVGTGKSTLAESFGQQLAKDRGITISVLRLSLRSRGTGAVGEMTELLGKAFDEVVHRGRSLSKGDALIVVIDEADAIAQSRELGQMHHEDRAGVNALIRGIDTVAEEGHPVVVIMCTNRLAALDPAVRRRAAAEFDFPRPNERQRLEQLTSALCGCKISNEELTRPAKLTGDDGRGYGHTYSDIANRVLPAAVLKSFPDDPITVAAIEMAIEQNPPTPPFHPR